MSQVQVKRKSRLRRSRRSRAHIKRLGVPRLTVHRTPQHIYAQVIVRDAQGDRVIAAASTVGKAFAEVSTAYNGSVESAKVVGKLIAERCLAADVKAIAFDRSGFKFHGRVKALADAARENGLEF